VNEPRPPVEWYLRSVQSDMDVRYADRIITLVAVPYDEDAAVHSRGRWITESVAPGSFDGVEYRASRIRVNRDHDVLRSVGRAVTLYPSRVEGLVADLRIARTPLGDETLELAADGVLDASVGYAPMPGGESYTENRTRRRITKAFLGHIALTPEPAYEGANVLSVRHSVEDTARLIERVSTPNLDRILADRMDADYRSRQ
jgi:HK97 family phage prohead protease